MKRPVLVLVLVFLGAGIGVLVAILWPSNIGSSYKRSEQQLGGAERVQADLEMTPAKVPPIDPQRSHLAVPTAPDGIVRDPTEEGYNPVLLLDIGMHPGKIFEREPRDPLWAAAMESRISSQLSRDLAVRFSDEPVQLEKLECRTSSCMAVVLGPDARAQDIDDALVLPALADSRMSDRTVLRDGGRREFHLFLLVHSAHHDVSAYDEWQKRRRPNDLAALRARGYVVPLE